MFPKQFPDFFLPAGGASRARGWMAVREALAGLALAVAALAGVAWTAPALAQVAGQMFAGQKSVEQKSSDQRSAGGPVRVEAVEVELVARESAVVPGQPLTLGLRIRHDPHWHTYWRNPGDSGLATQLELTLPQGFAAGEFRWPAPKRLFIPPLANYGYEDEIVLPLPVSVPAALEGGSVRLAGKAMWLMCRDVCIPGEAEVSLTLPVAQGAAPPPSRHAALFDAARARMPAEALSAPVSVDGDRLSIGLAEPLASAEFFPYREGLIGNAEPQPLFALEGAGKPARRLEIRLSAEGARAAADAASLLQAAEGIVVAGDRVFELKPVAASGALAGGTEIARVAGAPPAGGGASGAMFSGGTGGGLLAGLGGPASQPAGDASASGRGGAVAASSGAAGTGLGAMNLLVAALFAAIGGLILNLMPCVFPVIGLKVLGFARHGGAGDEAHTTAARSASRAGAFAFASGVVVSFWVLAGLLLALRAAGQAAGWGFQLQSPVFVAAMALLFVAIALNFSGVWEFGAAMTRLGQYDPAARAVPAGAVAHGGGGAAGGSPLLGSFGSGALAVLVATPCTAPFMGSALGFTLSATVLETLIVFTALGLGMALPYLLLGLFPAWLRWLPRPGRWMESFRQALAFPMYATAAWLAWVLGQQAGIDAVLALAIGAVLIGLAAWLYGRFVQQAAGGRDPGAARRRRTLAASLAVVSLAAGLLVAWPGDDGQAPGRAASGAGAAAPPPGASADAAAWHPWSPEALAQARAAGRPVFVDFTAAWCVSCQVNKKLVLDRDTVVEAMRSAGMLRLKADWTNRDPGITAELARHGRNGVPLYLVYLPGVEQPVVLPELLTNGIVLDALEGLERKG
jgi:thiol:disulfide interchange protein DsbD